MAKYLIFVPPFLGHVFPTLGIGRELIQRGNEVTWVGISDIDQSFFPTEGRFIYPLEFRNHNDNILQIIKKQEEGIGMSVNKTLKWGFQSTWLPFYYAMSEGILTVIKRENPDIIIHDEGIIAAAVAAHKLKIPYITSISTLPGIHYPGTLLLSEDDRWLQEVRQNILSENDIDSKASVLNSPYLNLIYSSTQLCDGSAFPSQYSFVGPIINGRPETAVYDWSKLDFITSPIIYVSTGSLLKDIKEEFYKKVIKSFEGQPVTVLLTVDPDTFDEWPSNFIPQTFWPQLDLLPRVDAVVSPGGFNTINETLFFGKPLLIIPLANDQFGNSLLVEKKGCGLRLRYRRLTPEALRNSVFELLNSKIIKTMTKEESTYLRKAGGEKKAVDLIENMLTATNATQMAKS